MFDQDWHEQLLVGLRLLFSPAFEGLVIEKKSAHLKMHIYRDLPGQLSLTTKRHCTISMGPFDVIISYKCCKNALSGRKLVTELFRADLVTFFL